MPWNNSGLVINQQLGYGVMFLAVVFPCAIVHITAMITCDPRLCDTCYSLSVLQCHLSVVLDRICIDSAWMALQSRLHDYNMSYLPVLCDTIAWLACGCTVLPWYSAGVVQLFWLPNLGGRFCCT